MIKDYGSYLGIIALIVSILTLLYHYFGWVLNTRKDIFDLEVRLGERISNEIKTCPLRLEIKSVEDKLDAHLIEASERLSSIETKMELFWDQVRGAVSSMIKQPTHFRKDELMDKLMKERTPNINNEELFELKIILKEELPDLTEKKSDRSMAYALALAYIDQILFDRGCLEKKSKIPVSKVEGV